MNYKNHTNLFRIVILINVLLSIASLSLNAQGFLKEPYDSVQELSVPFPVDSTFFDNQWCLPPSYGEKYMKSLKLYDTFNLDHEFEYSIKDECYGFRILGKFSLPDSEYKIILAHADYIDYSCSGLFLSDRNGNQIDYLACLNDCTEIVVRQFFIDKNYNITVYSLVPDSGDIRMLDLWNKIKSFSAHRVDKKYRVINGHFTLLETVTYQSKVYYSSAFLDGTSFRLRYRIRNGNETIKSIQKQ